MVAKRSARGERTRAVNQTRALIVTGPDDLRARFGALSAADLVAEAASMRPRPGEVVGYATRFAVRELGRRAEFLDDQLDRLNELIVALVGAHAPHPARHPRRRARHRRHTPHRRRRPSPTAPLRGCMGAPVRCRPIPASSGKVTRHRLNPGGDRQANHALWRIVITPRMSSHPPTRAYVQRRCAEGKTKTEIIRCLKRYVAREVYPHLAPAAD